MFKNGSIQLFNTCTLLDAFFTYKLIFSFVNVLTHQIPSHCCSIFLRRNEGLFHTSIPCAININFVLGENNLIRYPTINKLMWLSTTTLLCIPCLIALLIKFTLLLLAPTNDCCGKYLVCTSLFASYMDITNTFVMAICA